MDYGNLPSRERDSLWSTYREFSIDNLLVRIHFTIVMIRWTGLAPWEFESPFPGSNTSTFLGRWTTATCRRARGTASGLDRRGAQSSAFAYHATLGVRATGCEPCSRSWADGPALNSPSPKQSAVVLQGYLAHKKPWTLRV